ncbi:MAG: hypothetical protein WCP16_23055 [Pseudanabaena sp. ELA645]
MINFALYEVTGKKLCVFDLGTAKQTQPKSNTTCRKDGDNASIAQSMEAWTHQTVTNGDRLA